MSVNDVSQQVSCVADDLLEALELQKIVCRNLRQVAALQRQYVSAGDPGGLMGVLAERGRLTETLGLIGRRLGGVPEVRERMSALTGERRRRADECLADTHADLQSVMQSDAEDVRHLAVRKQRVQTSLQAIPACRELLNAYGHGAGESLAGTNEQG